MNLSEILSEILKHHIHDVWGIHGIVHWARVRENGLKLAEVTGADTDIVSLFALFHDSQRFHDGHDHGHGLRGARLASHLRGKVYELPDEKFELLFRACEWHTDADTDPDITVQTCFDADRLDLGRVGITPDPRYLCTEPAKTHEMIQWAHKRALADYQPEIVSTWKIPIIMD